MKYEDKVRVARERVFQAEEAMDAYIHGKEYDSERFARLSDDVTTARNRALGSTIRIVSTRPNRQIDYSFDESRKDHRMRNVEEHITVAGDSFRRVVKYPTAIEYH